MRCKTFECNHEHVGNREGEDAASVNCEEKTVKKSVDGASREE